MTEQRPLVAGLPTQAQGMDLTNPNIANKIRAMMLAQYEQQAGSDIQQQGDQSPTGTQFVPSANQYAPAMAIRQSPFVPLAGAAEKLTGAYMQNKGMQKQLDLAMAMQQARDAQKFGSGTPSGGSPMAAAMQPSQGVPNGSGAPPVPPVSAGIPLPPPAGYSQAGGAVSGSPTPPTSAIASAMNATPNAAIPPPNAAPSATPPPINQTPTMGGLGGETPQAPPALPNAPLSTGNPPPAQSANPNVPNGMTPDQARALSYSNPDLYQKMLDAQVTTQAKNAELTPEQKNTTAAGLISPVDFKEKESEAGKLGENTADAQKTFNVMQSNLPMVLQRFENMRGASSKASSGAFVDNEGDGLKQDFYKNFNNSPTAEANNQLQQYAAQGILPELGPQLQQAGIKGNKFLETLASSASGLDMSAPPSAKLKLVNGLENTYINNLKSTANTLRLNGQKNIPSDADLDAAVAKLKGANPTVPAAGGNRWKYIGKVQ